jgi:predicted DNA-binding transcriptional regulator YafY
MARADRLLSLIDALRARRAPVTGAALAESLGISIRTLYRDIATLRGQGAPIDGEPGLGYLLRPGFLLPPLMFAEDEIEALVLGTAWVADRGDPRLAAAARTALGRIGAVLPARLADRLSAGHLVVGPPSNLAADQVELAVFRRAIRAERKLRLTYRDADGRLTERVIWPFQIGFFDGVRLVSGWCELRQGIRHFRTDRIEAAEDLAERMPRRRHDLVAEWRVTDPSAAAGS